MMARPKIIYGERYKGHEILLSQQGMRTEILSAIDHIYTYMWKICSKRLFVIHYTVNIPAKKAEYANAKLCGTLQSWRKTMLRNKIPVEYIWGREIGACARDFHPHYEVYVIIAGKYIQSAKRVTEHLCRLLAQRLDEDPETSRRFHINPPMEDSFRWGKKVSAKLDNLEDAIQWTSYVAKVSTKNAPRYQKTFGYSLGFKRMQEPTCEYSSEDAEAFDSVDLLLPEEDWNFYVYEDFDPRIALNFNPETGTEFVPVPVTAERLSVAREC